MMKVEMMMKEGEKASTATKGGKTQDCDLQLNMAQEELMKAK